MRDRVFIDGERLYLRVLVKKDVNENYIHWFDDEEVCRYNSHHCFPYSEEDMLEYIEGLRGSISKLVLAVVAKDKNTHIGNVSLQGIDIIGRNAEFAVIMGEKDYWGKGYAAEAGRLITQHGFISLNMHRIYTGTSLDNLPMQKLAKALGFKEEGVRREAMFKNGRYVDVVEYGLLKYEWLEYTKQHT